MRSDTTTTTTAPLLVDRREAARLLGVCPNTVSNLQRRGDLVPVRIGARVLFDVADLHRYIESRKGAAQ
ncbi:MAG: helix-turn-helix domain-containing protein [Phycisphaeraceae bacterium]|nr:helix-turn-helix domain-containing protein [Phycisphaeraceae bacterium]MBX3367241.1 helix-turn-helix domain-containing protein [Phycisphaeraceae bacterium]